LADDHRTIELERKRREDIWKQELSGILTTRMVPKGGVQSIPVVGLWRDNMKKETQVMLTTRSPRLHVV